MTDPPAPMAAGPPYYPDTATRTDAGLGQIVVNGSDVEIQTTPPLDTTQWIRRLYVNQGVVVGNPVGGDMGPGTLNVEGAIYSSSGPNFLSSGTIVGPTSYVSFDLPANYSKFVLSLWDIMFIDADSLAMAFSYDDGATWLNDNNNSDSYTGVANLTQNLDAENLSIDLINSVLLGSLTTDPAMQIPFVGEFNIYPGSSLFYSYIQGTCGSAVKENPPNVPYSWQVQMLYNTVNPYSTVSPGPPKRATNVAFWPEGNADMPPTSTNRLVSGSWTLFGVPSPTNLVGA